jgi:hypothetical protein
VSTPSTPDEKRRPGRPATGVTPKRQIRIGATWDRCEALAAAEGERFAVFVERALLAEERRMLRAQDRRNGIEPR